MKPLITLVTLLYTVVCVDAQWKVGPKASVGVITANSAAIPVMPMTDYLTYEMEYIGNSSVMSVGFMAFNNLGPVFLQTEFLATKYDLNFKIANYKSREDPQLYEQVYYMVEIPFAAGVNFKNFKIGLGPVFEINVDKESDFNIMDNYVDQSQNLDFGFHGLVGYRIGVLHIDLKYVYKFSGIVDDFTFGHDEFMYAKSANRFSFSVGVAF